MSYTPPLPQHIWYEFLDAYAIPGGCGIAFALADKAPEYQYTPRGCANIWFEFKDQYIAPEGCSIVFRVGESPDIDTFGFTPSNVQFDINIDTMRSYPGMMIIPEKVNIFLNLEDSVIDPIWPIEIQSMSIGLEVGDGSIEILPDMIISGINFQTLVGESVMRKTESFHLPTNKSSGIKNFPWKEGSKTEKHHTILWNTPKDIRVDNFAKVVGPINIDSSKKSSWKTLGKIDNSISDRYKCDNMSIDVSYLSGHKIFTNYDSHILKPWGNTEIVNVHKLIPFKQPSPNDRHNTKSWDTPKESDDNLLLSYKTPNPKDSHVKKAWGPFSYYTLCNENYKAPKGCNVLFEFPNKYELVPNICSGIQFNVSNYMTADPRCQYSHAHSGIRDKYVWVDPENKNLIYPVDLGVYHMLNVILVEEVVTGTPIEILHVDAKIDISSWLWSFNVTVASKCFLDIIKPQDGILGNIKINMNGWIFFCTVEGWSENRAFGSDAWTITGRSPSLLFGSPICEQKTNIITEGKQGQTIFEDFMIGRTYALGWPFQLWNVDFSAYVPSIENPQPTSTGFQPTSDWYLPANTVSYSDMTDIDVLKNIANSIGAYIQTSPTTDNGLKTGYSSLVIKPRFSHQPWNWNNTNEGIVWKTINEAQCTEIARSNDVRIEYQAVNILGESLKANETNTGAESTSIYTNVVKNGYDSGSNEGSTGRYAPMETSPYITTSKAALEKGRIIIGQSGEWIKHSLRIGFVCENNGLYSVGDMVSVLERGTPWYGQVTGVQISAITAGSGFAIEQVLEVEEYIGD